MNIKYKNLRNDLQETLLEAGIKDAMVPLESTCNVIWGRTESDTTEVT